MKLIYGSLLMSHEYAARALVELMQVGKTPAGTDPVFHHAPEAFNRIEVVAAPGRQEMQAKLLVPVSQCRGELVCPVDATPVDDHDDLFPGMAKEGHHLMDILAKSLRIKMGNHFIEDFRGAILDGTHNTEQYAVGHAAPTPIAYPRLAFEGFVAFDLTRAQRACGQTIPLGFAPPARSGQGKAPQDRFVGIEQDDLTPPGLVLERSQFERGIGEGSRVRR